MSNGELIEVGAYDRITDVAGFVKQMGRSIALSKMFGVDTEAQGEILALECLSRRQPPLALAERYHFIFGKLSMKAEAMLADFRAKMGGKYEIVERTAEAAEVALELNGTRRSFRVTWDEAQKEPFVYDGKEKDILPKLAAGKKPELKGKYQTPRARMQMLWARVVSDAVRVMAPEITSGAYTPEEIEDFDELPNNGNGASGGQAAKKTKSASGGTTTTVMGAVVTANTTNQSQAAPEAAATTTVTPTPAPTATATTTQPTLVTEAVVCTGEQSTRIVELLGVLQPKAEDIEAMKQRRGVNAWRQLTFTAADELIGKLKQAIDQKKAAASVSAASTVTAVATPIPGVRNTDPATIEQQNRIRQLGGEVEQLQPGFTAKLVAKLRESGLARLADLTVSEADDLIQQLVVKNLDAFFAASLEGHAKFRPTNKAEQEQAEKLTATAG